MDRSRIALHPRQALRSLSAGSGAQEQKSLVAPNCLPGDESLAGEPECVALYRSVADATKVGAHAMRALPCDVRFGPWMEEEEEGRPSSEWMQCIQCTTCTEAANLISFHYKGLLYCKTSKEVKCDEELLLLEEVSPLYRDLPGYAENPSLDQGNSNQSLSISSSDERTDEESQQSASIDLPSLEEQKNTIANDPVIPQLCVQSGTKTGLSNAENLSYHSEERSGEWRLIFNESPKASEKDQHSNDCTVGNKDLSAGVSLKVEKEVHNPELPYKCSVCDKSFKLRKNLTDHARTHSSERAYKCLFCKKDYKTRRERKCHERVHTGERPYSCSVCDKRFSYYSSWYAHQHTHTRPFLCSICNKRFSKQRSLKIHSYIHTGEQPFTCPVCGKAFITPMHLKTHVKCHVMKEPTPFPCPLCKEGFTSNNCLNLHKQTHAGDGAFTCSYCKRQFLNNKNLIVHERLHNGKSQHKCSVCLKSFAKASTLAKHVGSACTSRPFWCTLCNVSVSRKSRLKRHYWKCHSK